jgi:peptide/nickel transport system substrate-binding protein
MHDKDALRRSAGPLENHLIDEYRAGHVTRGEFLRRGTVLGMSLTALLAVPNSLLRTRGAAAAPLLSAAQPKSGGTILVASAAPGEALDPVTASSHAAELIFSQVGDFLVWGNENLHLEPRLAQSWHPNKNGTVWTFNLRQNVTFHDGTPMTAKDVVATFSRLADPATKSNALSAFKGTLEKSGVRAVGTHTVEFHLNAPNGNFPYLVSSDNYNAIVQPAERPNNWEQSFMGTGPWVFSSYNPSTGLQLKRNPQYWDASRQPLADALTIQFFNDVQSQIVAALAGNVQVVVDLPAIGVTQALVSNKNVRLVEIRSGQHPEIHMRSDVPPFNDKRVREAMALLLDRPGLVSGLIYHRGEVGNDSPFAPVYPSTVAVAQRKQNVAKAKSLLAAAGHPKISMPVYAPQLDEVPDLSVLLQNAAKHVGAKLTPQIVDEAKYYDQYWLDTKMSITKYVHRGVPNVFLTATLTSQGPWNAAHFKDATYDKLVKQYVAAVDLQSQRRLAKRIEQLLLDKTPVIIPYFTHNLVAVRKELVGTIRTTATNQLDVTRAGFA